MKIIALNFFLFPAALLVIGLQLSLFPWFSLMIGILVASIAPMLQKYKNNEIAIKWLKTLTIATLTLYATLLFIQIGANLLYQQKFTATSSQSLFLSALLIFALFVYFLLLTQLKTKTKRTLDQTLSQVLLRPSIWLCLLVATILSILELLLMQQLAIKNPSLSWLTVKFLERGFIPPLTLLLFNWGLLLLLGKWFILLKETKQAHNSLLLAEKTSNSSKFWKKVWLKSDAFYVLPSYINYALPILGFIGTVLGISMSAEGIADIIASPNGLTSSNQSLGSAIAPLGIAFDTTLIALSLGLLLTLVFALLQSWETRTLNQLKSIANAKNK